MQQNFVNQVRTFGTTPVFFTSIATILGAIMFLRFGFAVGQVGFMGAIAIIIIGHAVTIPTAMAIAEIATNQKVEGGGEYYIISRSFGLVIGSTIGIALYFSQAISIAFYVMAFSEAFTIFFDWLIATLSMPDWLSWLLRQKQTIGIPGLLLLTYESGCCFLYKQDNYQFPQKNIEFISQKSAMSIKHIINEKSKDADLTIVGLIEKVVEHNGMKTFEGYDAIGNILFVNAAASKEIK